MKKDNNRVPLRGTLRQLTSGRSRIAPVNKRKVISVTLTLRWQADPEFLTAPGKHLTVAQASRRFSHAAKDEAVVRRFAREYNLQCKDVLPGQIQLEGTVGDVSRAFGVDLFRYKEQKKDAVYHSHDEEVSLPAYLASVVTGVFGLDVHPAARRPGLTRRMAAAGIAPPPVTAKTRRPGEFAQLYHFPTDTTGRGQSIGLLEFDGGFRTRELQSYFTSLTSRVPRIVVKEIPPGANRPRGKPGTLNSDTEVYLDIEVAGSLAPDAAIVVYFGENTEQGWLRTLHAAILDQRHDLSVISISWGQAEQDWSSRAMVELDRLFQLAAHRGITVCCSSGDNGVSEATGHPFTVAFPATSPHVLACGGTRLDVKRGGAQEEKVWNQWRQYGLASGGGVSHAFRPPSYQKKARFSVAGLGARKGRGIPDVAANASSDTGYLIEADKTRMSMGGTSAVAPLWAALVARLNEALRTRVGFLNPTLYTMADKKRDCVCDIVKGFNGPTRSSGYQARKGWDACTGLGSPHGERILQWLKQSRK